MFDESSYIHKLINTLLASFYGQYIYDGGCQFMVQNLYQKG